MSSVLQLPERQAFVQPDKKDVVPRENLAESLKIEHVLDIVAAQKGAIKLEFHPLRCELLLEVAPYHLCAPPSTPGIPASAHGHLVSPGFSKHSVCAHVLTVDSGCEAKVERD